MAMKRVGIIALSAVIVLGILSYMFCYQVRYDQVAVVTWFNEATDNSVQSEPGLKFRMPWPANKVTQYPRRIELVEDKLEELQTADKKTIIVRTYLAWRISDPLRFSTRLTEIEAANRQLTSDLREIRGIISEYTYDQLVNIDPQKIKLGEIEQRAQDALAVSVEERDYGITIERVGIYRVMLPEAATQTVFDTMIKTRERLAESARQEGAAQALAIRSEAEQVRDRIRLLAERRAQELRSEGDREAAQYYDEFAKDEEFAIFLRKVETLKEVLSHHTTFVLNSDSLNMLELLDRDAIKPMAQADDSAEAVQMSKNTD
jgi:membrane protease subunit HflC